MARTRTSQEVSAIKKQSGLQQWSNSPRRGSTTRSVFHFEGGWDDPLTSIRRMAEELERLFEGLVGVSRGPFSRGRSSAASTWTPPIEVIRKDDMFVIRADVPGIGKEDLKVEIQDGVLTIEGERCVDCGRQQGGSWRTERTSAHFYRSIQLPDGIDAETVQAFIRDGVLEISIPTHEHQDHRQLEIPE